MPTPALDDDEISFTFSHSLFGDSFGADVLAATVYSYRGDTMLEADVVYNLAYHWDIPDGIPPPDEPDFGAVTLHEFGHVLGLEHPDDHGQVVDAIMNSHLQDYHVLQSDDYLGVLALYSSGPGRQFAVDAPVLKNLSTRADIGSGGNVLVAGFIVGGDGPATMILRAIGQALSAWGVANPLFDPRLTVYDSEHRVVAENDDWIDGPYAETIAGYQLDPENSLAAAVLLTLDPGAYTVVVEGVADTEHAGTGLALVELYDLATTAGHALNMSTRGQVLTGEDVMIGGFIIGNRAKDMVIRALGPSLAHLESQILCPTPSWSCMILMELFWPQMTIGQTDRTQIRSPRSGWLRPIRESPHYTQSFMDTFQRLRLSGVRAIQQGLRWWRSMTLGLLPPPGPKLPILERKPVGRLTLRDDRTLFLLFSPTSASMKIASRGRRDSSHDKSRQNARLGEDSQALFSGGSLRTTPMSKWIGCVAQKAAR